MYPCCFGFFEGSESGSNLGPVASNGENIASGRESLGMRPRNLRPCGRQQTPEYIGSGGLSMAY